MIVAVSMVMQKNTGLQVASHARLSVLHGCSSVEDAKGQAITVALGDEHDYTIASICAAEVTPPPKEISEESAELRTTGLKSSLRKLFHNFF